MIIEGITINFKPSILKGERLKYKYMSNKNKMKTVVYIKPYRYAMNIQGSQYKYYSNQEYRDAVNQLVTLVKCEWDREFYLPEESKINKIV
jgi:hypothetical protein